MSAPRKATKIPGLKYTEHPTRKNGLQKDKYYLIIYKMKGKQKEEAIGWASQGWTEKKAAAILFELKENQRKGEGPQTLKEKRELLQKKAEEEEAKKQKESKTKIKIRDAFDMYLKDGDKTDSYIYNKKGQYKKWIEPIIGDKILTDIDYTTLEEIKNYMLKNEKLPATIESTIKIISRVYNFMKRIGLYSGEDPTKLIKLPKVNNRRTRFYTQEEVAKLFTALKAKSVETYELVYFALYTGLRAGSIFKLEWSDVDFENNLLLVRNAKGLITEKLPLNEKARELLLEKHKSRTRNLIFTYEGRPITRISRTFARTVKELGLNKDIEDNSQKDVFHTLRHTYASWLVISGADLYSVQHLLMHKNITTTQRYAHLAPDYLRKAVKVLDKIDIK